MLFVFCFVGMGMVWEDPDDLGTKDRVNKLIVLSDVCSF